MATRKMSTDNQSEPVVNGRPFDHVIRCFEGAFRGRHPLTDEQKRLAAELVIRHGRSGLTFVVKVMKDHGLIARSTYDRDCMGVRRALLAVTRKGVTK